VSSILLYKNLMIKIYRTKILLVVLFRCETWSFKLREETRLKLFENMVVWRIFGPEIGEVIREQKNYIMRNLMISIPQPIFLE